MLVNADLHIHSKYSAAVSKDMELSEIARTADKKGVGIVGTGDCLHPLWLKEIQALPEEGGLFSKGDTRFALTVEVEDSNRVHHLILIPDISKALELRESFSHCSNNLSSDGRPKLQMNGAEIADIVLEAGGLLGPCHAFTPWTGIFAHYPTLLKCYNDKADQIKFIELGLSADTDYADRIEELSNLTFLSNSDAHSPRTNKLAREFNQMQLHDLNYEELIMAIKREGNRRLTLNVGLYPEEGKYNRTACIRCFEQYSAIEKDELMGRCPKCRGLIKLGVSDRVDYLATFPKPIHPIHRPPYRHLIPLGEIIALALGHKSVTSTSVQRIWNKLTENMTEIQILMDAKLTQLNADSEIVEAINSFRQGKVTVVPGGGGKYGEIRLDTNEFEKTDNKSKSITMEFSKKQTLLFDFDK